MIQRLYNSQSIPPLTWRQFRHIIPPKHDAVDMSLDGISIAMVLTACEETYNMHNNSQRHKKQRSLGEGEGKVLEMTRMVTRMVHEVKLTERARYLGLCKDNIIWSGYLKHAIYLKSSVLGQSYPLPCITLLSKCILPIIQELRKKFSRPIKSEESKRCQLVQIHFLY